MRLSTLDHINPFVKSIVILVCCIMMALTQSWKVNVAVFLVWFVAMLVFSKCKIKSLIITLIPVVLLALIVFVSGLFAGRAGVDSDSLYTVGNLESALVLGTRILSYVIFGLLFGFTTDSKEFIMSLMHQAKLKPKFAYGVLAAVNLVPTLQREWAEVNLAYQARRKSTGIIPFGPMFNTLVNGIRWSENVAMAMESKGFDGEGARTFSIETRVGAKDYIYAVVSIVIMAVIVVVFH